MAAQKRFDPKDVAGLTQRRRDRGEAVGGIPRTYVGRRRAPGLVVTVRTESGSYSLAHVVRHSPTGFECGYPGSGPSDLARCILLDHFGIVDVEREKLPDVDEREKLRRVERLYQEFKADVVAELDRAGFELPSSTVDEWLEAHP